MKISINRLQIIGLFSLLAALILIIVSRSRQHDVLQAKSSSMLSSQITIPPSSKSESLSGLRTADRDMDQNRQAALPEKRQVKSSESFPEIEQLLTSDNISNEQAARQLAEIALNPNRRESERLEAMEHAKNLGFSNLLPLSLDPNLPLPLAESFLQGLHGHDQIKDQVTGALGLLNHSDSDIRQQAQTLIGFLIGAEEDNESPDKLREKADVFLKKPDEGDGEVNGQ